MNINAAIIDQMLNGICNKIKDRAGDEFRINDDVNLKSLAFVYLCVKVTLDLTDENEIFDCLTDGGGDFGIDAFHISPVSEGEFTVTLFQGKYKQNLEGDANFPEGGIMGLINAVRYLLDPKVTIENINSRLKAQMLEARSLIQDFNVPQVRVIACNNGLIWSKSADEQINCANFGKKVTWEHINHDHLLTILQTTKKVNNKIQFSGKAIVEDIEFVRVLIGRVAVSEIEALIERHGERLLEKNIRRYLVLQGNRVNEAIELTLKDNNECIKFYFYNNGITLTCDKFTYNALQSSDYQVRVENLQIINGGQTCMTIYKTLKDAKQPYNAYVLVRLYQLPSDNENLVGNITYATNSQNPVALPDLRANDKKQISLETDIAQLGYTYRRKKSEAAMKQNEINIGIVAEAILAVWRKKPHQAKFFSQEHFGKLYNIIFSDSLTGAQAIIATLIYRFAENKRKRPPDNPPTFIRYTHASCSIAMQMGKYLLQDMECSVEGITHKSFNRVMQLFNENAQKYFDRAISSIQMALNKLYGETQLPPQSLSATFRRGDLIEILNQVDRESCPRASCGLKP
ncbi:MAG: AIPR family protein [Nitrospirae bacterium]|nr:AIPR family protein [Nitrospirota bacterium]